MLIVGQKSCILRPTIFKFHNRTDINMYSITLVLQVKMPNICIAYYIIYIEDWVGKGKGMTNQLKYNACLLAYKKFHEPLVSPLEYFFIGIFSHSIYYHDTCSILTAFSWTVSQGHSVNRIRIHDCKISTSTRYRSGALLI